MCHVVSRRVNRSVREMMLGVSAALGSAEADVQDAKTFSTAVNAAIRYSDLSATHIGKHFGVNTSTVCRWAAGASVPHKLARPIVIDWIRRELEARALSLDGDEKRKDHEVALANGGS